MLGDKSKDLVRDLHRLLISTCAVEAREVEPHRLGYETIGLLLNRSNRRLVIDHRIVRALNGLLHDLRLLLCDLLCAGHTWCLNLSSRLRLSLAPRLTRSATNFIVSCVLIEFKVLKDNRAGVHMVNPHHQNAYDLANQRRVPELMHTLIPSFPDEEMEHLSADERRRCAVAVGWKM